LQRRVGKNPDFLPKAIYLCPNATICIHIEFVDDADDPRALPGS